MPDSITIKPAQAFQAALTPPGSKSLTNRALLLAALAEGESTIRRPLLADDTRAMLDALPALGFAVHRHDEHVTIRGGGGAIPAREATLNLGNAGTAMRPLTAACCLGQGSYLLDGVARMRQRPIGELVSPLRRLGATIDCTMAEGFPPLRITAHGLAGGEIDMAPTLSSQFITALLMVGPCMTDGLTIRFQGPITSRPYVEMTLALMARFGVDATVDPMFSQISVAPGRYRAIDYLVEPDASNASYFLAAAAVIPGSRITVEGLGFRSVQGDAWFAERVLQPMGAAVIYEPDAITVIAPPSGQRLKGIDIDLNAMPDMAQTLAVLALFADGLTTIRNVGNLRVKETDRMAALQTELHKLGATVTIDGDDLTIQPPHALPPEGATIDTYDDHRMAMSFAVAGLHPASHGRITLRDPDCVNKTFPDFFEYLDRLRP
jgi:3-phosphoshikimate 1-carboxyvinyltransferase